MKIKKIEKLLIFVNSGMDRPYSQYASYVVAFTAKKIHNIPDVMIYYGPQGVDVVKKGNLAKLTCSEDVKKLIASQFDGLEPEDLPDNLEQMAIFVKDTLGVKIGSCATFHVVDGFAASVDDTSQIEEFIMPVKIPDAVEAALSADKILFF
jgi:Predicted peroxiredoxins